MSAPEETAPAVAAFGRRVRELRTGRGWSLRQMAAMVPLVASALHRIEQGGGTTLATAERVSAVFGLALWVMLGPDPCGHCHGSPRPGFGCLECGAKGPGVAR